MNYRFHPEADPKLIEAIACYEERQVWVNDPPEKTLARIIQIKQQEQYLGYLKI